MKSHEKKRLEDLEKRVKELEARPFWPQPMVITVQPAVWPPPFQPYVPTWPPPPTIIYGTTQIAPLLGAQVGCAEPGTFVS